MKYPWLMEFLLFLFSLYNYCNCCYIFRCVILTNHIITSRMMFNFTNSADLEEMMKKMTHLCIGSTDSTYWYSASILLYLLFHTDTATVCKKDPIYTDKAYLWLKLYNIIVKSGAFLKNVGGKGVTFCNFIPYHWNWTYLSHDEVLITFYLSSKNFGLWN